MLKKNVVSFKDIDRVIKAHTFEPKEISLDVGGEVVTVIIDLNISFADKAQMISDIVDMSFIDGEYKAYAESIATTYNFLKYFTNLKFGEESGDKLNNNMLNRVYRFAKSTNIMAEISKIFQEQGNELEDIKNTIASQIEYERQCFYQAMSPLSSVGASITNLIADVDMALNRVQELLENVDKNDIKELFDAIKKLDNSAIAKLVLGFKKNKNTERPDNVISINQE